MCEYAHIIDQMINWRGGYTKMKETGKTKTGIRLLLIAVMTLILSSVTVFAAEPVKPDEVAERETKKIHHEFSLKENEANYYGKNELIMPGDTFEFPVVNVENDPDAYFGLSDLYILSRDYDGYWTSYDCLADDFEVEGEVECIGEVNKYFTSDGKTETVTFKTKFENKTQCPILLWGLGSGSDGYGNAFSSLAVIFLQPYYTVQYNIGNPAEGNTDDTYFWPEPASGKPEFTDYYWITDTEYVIKVPNPVEEGYHFKKWSGIADENIDTDDHYSYITVCWDSDIVTNGGADRNFKGYGDIKTEPEFENGPTVAFYGNGGKVNGRDKWVLEVNKDSTNAQNPVYDFNLDTANGDVIATKEDDTFLGWCAKEDTLYNFYYKDGYSGEEKKASGSFLTKDSAADLYEGYELDDANYSNNGGKAVVYAKWESNTEEFLEKNGYKLQDDGTLWFLNNDGVASWVDARKADPTLAAKVKDIKTGFGKETVSYITDYDAEALAGCTGLTELTLQGISVSCSFKGCTNLKKINLDPADVVNYWSSLGYSLFEGTSMDLVINVPADLLIGYKEQYPAYAYLFNADTTAHRYPLTVGGEIFTDKKLSVQCGDGTATFDPDTSILTLENATVSGNMVPHWCSPYSDPDNYENFNKAAIISDLPELTIVLKGDNTIRAEDTWATDFVRAYGDLVISGDGSIEETVYAENYVTDGVPYDGPFKLPVTALGDVSIDGITASKLEICPEGSLHIKDATLIGTSIKAKDTVSIENSVVERDTEWGGPNGRPYDTVISAGKNLIISGSMIGNQSGEVALDCGEENVAVSIKDSKLQPRTGLIKAGSNSTMVIENSQILAYGQNGMGVTNILVANITLKDCEITAGTWAGIGQFVIDATGNEIPGPDFIEYTVRFNTNNGSEVQPQKVLTGQKATKPADPTKEGKKFAGWYTSWDYKVEFDFDQPIRGDVTAYAKWLNDSSSTHTHTADTTKWVSDATNHWHVCKGGDGQVMDKAAHTFDTGKVVKNATETAEGEMTYTCTACKYQKTETIAKLSPSGSGQAGDKETDPLVTNPVGSEVKAKDGKAEYEVTGKTEDASGKEILTVTYTEPEGKEEKATKVEIPAEVQLSDGTTAQVTEIAPKAFENNKKVKTVTIGKNVTTVGTNAFAGCKNLTTVKVNGTAMTTIGEGAFKNCPKLKSVVIGKNVTRIGKNAFAGNKKLKTITFKTTKLTKAKVGKKAFANINKNATVYYPKSLKGKKLTAFRQMLKKGGIPGTVKLKKK